MVRFGFVSATVLAVVTLTTGCTHFPKEPVSRSAPGGQVLRLATTRVCESEATAIEGSFKNPGTLTYSVTNEQGEEVTKGSVAEVFVIETRTLAAGRYEVHVRVDAENTLEVGFEVFRCRS